MTKAIDFWFSVGSTYTYLSVMRVDAIAASAGVEVNWRPFNVRQIISEIGNRPFTGKPVKMRYMWRDIERRAAGYRIPVKVPAPYPLPALDRANQVAILGKQEGWCEDYVRATYRRWFQEGLEPGTDRHLDLVLAEIGQEPERVKRLSTSAALVSGLAEATDEARQLGLFGAPTFAVGEEIFWGDDRLEDAVAWATGGHSS